MPDTIGATPTTPLDATALAAEVLGVLNASIDRADRALEILDQASGVGALRYWTGMLHIDASKENDTVLLMLVARALGEYVAMRLKGIYRMRRPAQVYPWIMPLIDGPDTPSFPSSHALQAHLISGVLKLAIPGATAPVWPPPASPAPWPPARLPRPARRSRRRSIGWPAASPRTARSPASTTAWTAIAASMSRCSSSTSSMAWVPPTGFKKLLNKAQDELKRLPVC